MDQNADTPDFGQLHSAVERSLVFGSQSSKIEHWVTCLRHLLPRVTDAFPHERDLRAQFEGIASQALGALESCSEDEAAMKQCLPALEETLHGLVLHTEGQLQRHEAKNKSDIINCMSDGAFSASFLREVFFLALLCFAIYAQQRAQ